MERVYTVPYIKVFPVSVYVAVEGSRGSDCGSFENPCQYIADVLFNRTKDLTIHLKAYTIESRNDTVDKRTRKIDAGPNIRSRRQLMEVTAVYHLDLPLNLFGSVSFMKYPKHSKHAPVIRSHRPRMFIMRNNQSFQSDGVDFELNHKGSILLDVDSKEFLKKIMIKNSEIIGVGSGEIAVNLKIYQEIGNFVAENITFKDGTLLHIQGISQNGIKTQKRKWAIKDTFFANNVTAKYLMKSEYVSKNDACNINQVKISNCKNISCGMHFDDASCTIRSITIKSTHFKQCAIDATGRDKLSPPNIPNIGRYLYNFPDEQPPNDIDEKKKKSLTFDMITIQNCNLTRAMHLSEIKTEIMNKFSIRNSNMDYTFDIIKTDFKASNIEIANNKVDKIIINHNKGTLLLDNLHIKQNEGDDNKRAISFQANPDKEGLLFKLKNSVIDWNKNNLTHPPIIDAYLGKGRFEVEKVNVTSYSKSRVVLTSIEVGTEFEKSSKLNNLTIHCNVNSDSLHVPVRTMRGEKLETICNPCNIGNYTQLNSFLRLKKDPQLANSSLKLSSQITKVEKADFECIQCPIGGNCENGIKSSGNFYGYPGKDKSGSVIFMACPKSYCCTKSECIRINSCRKYRNGTLCGSCKIGYQENFFSDECVKIEKCENIYLFWVCYTFSALVASVLFLYMKDIVYCLKELKMRIIAYFMKTGYLKQTEDPVANNKRVIRIGGVAERNLTMSGCFNIVVGFYQIRSLLTIDVGDRYKKANTYQEKITKFMDLNFNFIESLCPMKEMTAIGEGFIKNQLVVILMLGWALLFLVVYNIIRLVRLLIKRNEKQIDQLNGVNEEKISEHYASNVFKDQGKIMPITFAERIGLGMIKIILFGYKNVATFAVVAFHCVEVNGDNVMFIRGDTKCYEHWQIISMFFFGIWVVPFPAALMVSYRMYMWNVISLRKFVMCLIFPFTSIYLKITRGRIRCLNKKTGQAEKMVDIYLRENFEEAYRHRKGKKYYVFWETWRLYQRLILAVVTTYSINPVERICYSAPIILFFIFVYWYVKPYKKHFVVLHWMEVASLLGITFTLVNNMFRSFLYVFEIPDEKPVPQSLSVLWALDTIASPVFVFIIMKLWPSIKKLWEKVRECFQGVKDRI